MTSYTFTFAFYLRQIFYYTYYVRDSIPTHFTPAVAYYVLSDT